MRVILTRPDSEARRWAEDLRRNGLDTIVLPLITILPSPRPAELAAAWQRLGDCRSAMFVSGNAVRHFFDQRPAGAGWPRATRAWATGGGTRQALLEAGVPDAQVDAPPPEAAQFDSETLWQRVEGQVIAGDRVLIVRGADDGRHDSSRDWLAERLSAAEAVVEVAVAYLRAVPEFSATQAQQARDAADGDAVWLFSSSQAITNLQALLPRQDWARARAVATHPRIAQTARLAGFGVVCESRPPMAAVVAALKSFR
jgi:uroporphyrinogen-III synthase